MRTIGFVLVGQWWSDLTLHTAYAYHIAQDRKALALSYNVNDSAIWALDFRGISVSGYAVLGNEPKNGEIKFIPDMMKSEHRYARVHLQIENLGPGSEGSPDKAK